MRTDERPGVHAEAWRARLPRKRGSSGGAFALLAVMVLLVGGFYAHARLSRSPLWVVRGITVMGNRSLGTAEVLDRLGISPGTPWWKVRTQAVAKFRAHEPRLAELSLSFSWPRDLIVRVRERESFLRVMGEPPMTLATDGVLLAADEEIDPADLPLVSGLGGGLVPGQRLQLAAADGVWEEFHRLSVDCPEIWKSVSEIHHAGGRDFRVFLRDGRKVLLWECGVNPRLKAAIPEILSDLSRHGQDDVVVDLRFRDQVVLRLPEGALIDSTDAVPPEPGADAASFGAPRGTSAAPARSGRQGSAQQGRRRA